MRHKAAQRANERIAQGNALGGKQWRGKRPKGAKAKIMSGFCPCRAIFPHQTKTQGDALGYVLAGPTGRLLLLSDYCPFMPYHFPLYPLFLQSAKVELKYLLEHVVYAVGM